MSIHGSVEHLPWSEQTGICLVQFFVWISATASSVSAVTSQHKKEINNKSVSGFYRMCTHDSAIGAAIALQKSPYYDFAHFQTKFSSIPSLPYKTDAFGNELRTYDTIPKNHGKHNMPQRTLRICRRICERSRTITAINPVLDVDADRRRVEERPHARDVPSNCRSPYTLDLEKKNDLRMYRAPRGERPLE